MTTARIFLLCFLAFSLVTAATAVAQTLIGTVNAGTTPIAAAANRATNQIYVANYCGNDSSCQSAGTVTVIDGATNNTSTVTVGFSPYDVRVNPLTNKIYVSNFCGNDLTCQSGTVTVIDGATNKTTTVTVGLAPYQAAVNTVTNKIYVANSGGNTVTVIDGTTNNTTPVTVGNRPQGLAVNPVTNKIYVPNSADDTVTVIDGVTLATTLVQAVGGPTEVAVNTVTNQIYVANYTGSTVTVIDATNNNNTSTVDVDLNPAWVAVNQVTNQIYTANSGSNTVNVIDGATLNTTLVTVGNAPYELAVDPVTNKIYVANYNDGTMTMIDGATNKTTTLNVGNSPGAIEANVVTNKVYVPNQANNTVSVIAGASAAPLQFVAATPCRVVDTRNANGQFGGPPITGGTSRSFPIPQQTTCNIPSTAAAYSLNVTLVPIQNGPVGYLTIWPTGEDQPLVSTMNSLDGRIKANAAIMPGGYQGAVSVFVTNTTNVVLDIDGYFATPGAQTLQFYPLTPCRVLDTRNANGDLGGPYLNGKTERDFPVLESPCIPSKANAVAYSLNFTVVPVQGQPLGYLTVWPEGGSRPLVSTLNNLTATIVANAAIVPAGTGGGIATYPDQNTQVVADIDGYFAAPGKNGLSLYPAAPCRVIDTRKVGNGQPFGGELTVDVVDSVCAPPSTAQAYVFNATVVPQGGLGYLTLWPDTENKPVVSTLNATDGAITSNMAVVPNINGKTDAYASGITQLILDISSYFAP